MNQPKFYFKILVTSLFFLVFGQSAEAAVLYVAPPAKNVAIGNEFFLDVKVNTEAVAVNAAQAVLRFPSGILTAVDTDKAGSIFNFWVEEPVISNETGTINFIGGTPKGVSGSALQLLRIKFKATGAGAADVTLSDAVVTASDGKGTNILSKLEGSKIGSGGTQVVTPAPAAPPTSTAAPKVVVIEPPKKVERVAIVAKNLSKQPLLSIPLYPDPLKWYSYDGEMAVFWDIPEDVIAVAIKLDHRSSTNPEIQEKELFNGKTFGSLEEGIWYVHAKFRNNVGWGPVAHYKISIDRAAPAVFEIRMDNPVTENPAPTIKYETNDALSGLGEISIFIDGKDPIKVSATSTSFVLPLQPAGKHSIVVRAIDKAGNAIEDDQNLEILPLAMPIIDFVSQSIVQGEIIFASGKALPDAFVDAKIIQGDKEVLAASSPSDASGNWSISIKEPLIVGSYAIQVATRDNRGAQSFRTEPTVIKIKRQPIISFGIIELGWLEISLLLLFFAGAAISLVAWRYSTQQKRRSAYKLIVGRDIIKFIAMLEKDIQSLKETCSSITLSQRSQMEINVRITRMQEKIDRMKKYIPEEMEEAG